MQFHRLWLAIITYVLGVSACDGTSSPNPVSASSGMPRAIDPACKAASATAAMLPGCDSAAGDVGEARCQDRVDDTTCGALAKSWYACFAKAGAPAACNA